VFEALKMKQRTSNSSVYFDGKCYKHERTDSLLTNSNWSREKWAL